MPRRVRRVFVDHDSADTGPRLEGHELVTGPAGGAGLDKTDTRVYVVGTAIAVAVQISFNFCFTK